MTNYLPAGWVTKPLSSALIRIESGTSVNGEDRQRRADELGVLKLNCLHNGLLDIKHHKAVLGNEQARVSGRVRGETIIISRKNTAELVGASAYSPEDVSWLYLSDLLWQLHINKSQAHPKWLAYLLRDTDARKRISACASGTSGSMKGITKSAVAALVFSFPSLPEQRRIVEILDEADAAVRTTDALIVAKRKFKHAWAERLLTGRVRFPEFAAEAWQEVTFGSLFQEVERPVIWDDDEHYKLVSVRRRSEGLFFRGKVQGETIKTKTLKHIKANDFLISKMQVVHGAWGLVTPEFDDHHVSASYITLVPKAGREIDMRFFNYLSQLPYVYRLALVSSHGVHIEKMTFNLELLYREKVRIPRSVPEQRKIAKVLSLMDEELGLLRRQLAALKAQKQGLMQKLLTGEVRTRSEAPAPPMLGEPEQKQM